MPGKCEEFYLSKIFLSIIDKSSKSAVRIERSASQSALGYPKIFFTVLGASWVSTYDIKQEY